MLLNNIILTLFKENNIIFIIFLIFDYNSICLNTAGVFLYVYIN